MTSKTIIVTILFSLSLINYTDRWSVAALLNDLQAPVKKGGFNLTDTEGGLVTSVFIVTYVMLSPVFGYFGDRVSRIPLIFGGIITWGLAGLFSSFTTYYWQFLVFRAVCGVGEASYAVLAPTIIADLYTGTDRTRVLGWYTSSIPLGSALGYIYAGEVARIMNWRWAFRITPFIGFILAFVLLIFVTEPPRGAADCVAPSSNIKQPARESGFSAFIRDASEIWQVRSFFWSTWGLVGMTFTAGALAQWATAMLQRVNCLPGDASCEAVITRTFGIVTIISGFLGCLIGPYLANIYLRRDPAADSVVSALALFTATPFVYAAIYLCTDRYNLTWLLIFVGETLVSFTWPLTTTIQLSVITPSLRNTANGISLTASHILGDSISPLVIGILADTFYSGKSQTRAKSLQNALYFSVITSFIAGFMFMLSAPDLSSDRTKAIAQFNDGYRSVDGEPGGRILDKDDEKVTLRDNDP